MSEAFLEGDGEKTEAFLEGTRFSIIPLREICPLPYPPAPAEAPAFSPLPPGEGRVRCLG